MDRGLPVKRIQGASCIDCAQEILDCQLLEISFISIIKVSVIRFIGIVEKQGKSLAREVRKPV